MTQFTPSAPCEAQAPLPVQSAAPPPDSVWVTPSGRRRPLPGATRPESPPGAQAPQARDADAPDGVPQPAPGGDPESPPRPQAPQARDADAPSGVPQPARPQAPQARDADAPDGVPQPAPGGDPESPPRPQAPQARDADAPSGVPQPARPQAPQARHADAPDGVPQPAPGGDPESPPRPQAPQARDADAPSGVPQPTRPQAPQARDADAPSGVPQPARPQAPQARHADAPDGVPQLAPGGDPESPPGAHAALRRTAPSAPRPVGIILFDRDKWAAACAGFDLRRQGRRSLPGGLPAEAVWIVCGTSLRLAKLRIGREFTGLSMHAGDWFGPWLMEILDDWGLKRCGLIDRAMALSAIADRTVGLAERAAARFASASGLPAAAPLLEAPSLAEGLRSVVCEAGPTPPCGDDAVMFAAAFQRGGAWATRPNRLRLEKRLCGPQPDPDLEAITRRGGAEAKMLAALIGGRAPAQREIPFEAQLRLRAPRLDHALDVLAGPVPDDGPWRPERIDGESLSDAKFRALAATGRPVLVNARAEPKPGVPHDACIASWGAAPGEGWPREDYTLNEVAEMLTTHEFRSPSALIGPGWRRPPEADLLDALVESIGSRRLAHASLSAGLVAAAILGAGMGPAWRGGWADYLGENGDPELVAPACVWLAARERILARDRLRAMGPVGDATHSVERGGGVGLYIWEDSASRAALASAAWEVGLHLPMHTAQRLREAGHPPASRPASWGGGRAAVLLAALSQRGDTERLWEIDQIACLSPAERAALRGTRWADMVEDAPWM